MFIIKVIYWQPICPCSLSRLFTDSLSVHVHHLSLTRLFIDGLAVHVHYQGYLLTAYLSMFIIKVIYWQPICPCSPPVTDKVIYWWSSCPCSLSRLFTDSLSVHVHYQGYLLTAYLSMFIIKVIYWQPICPCSSPVIDRVTYRWSICSSPVNNHFIYQWLQVCQWSCCLLLTYTSTITLSVDVCVSAIMLSTDHLHVNNHTI